jgi:hypothetical protein
VDVSVAAANIGLGRRLLLVVGLFVLLVITLFGLPRLLLSINGDRGGDGRG